MLVSRRLIYTGLDDLQSGLRRTRASLRQRLEALDRGMSVRRADQLNQSVLEAIEKLTL